MTHTEQIESYLYTRVANESAGSYEGTPILQELAPTWATIQQLSGNDLEINGRNATESVFDVTLNFPLNGFKYKRTMFITTRFGNLDITNIYEDQRKRTIKLTCVRVEGVGDGEGSGANADGIFTIYYPTTYGTTSVTNSILAGMDVLLAFRDGICKWVVNDTPNKPNKMQFFKADGRFDLMPGDIFGDELITVLYKTP